MSRDPGTSRQALALDHIFHPRSVAVVGATTTPRGDQFIGSLQEMKFPGPIYPVNPKAEEIMGLPCYPSLRDIPGPVDYVISNVPATVVPQIMEDCGAKGVRAIHFFTSGFSESGEAEREELERRLVERARELGIRIIGPNCMGLYVPASRLSFVWGSPKTPGPVALISQSGANAAEFVLMTGMCGLRFSKVISYGNGADLTESDFFEYCAEDPETKIITSYIEGVKDGRRFFRALAKAASRKPVIILKGGRTEAGGRAAQSHTASLAGSAQVFDVLCRQVGALQVSSLEELGDVALAFYFLGSLTGPGAGIIGGGGGRSVLSADEFVIQGLKVPALPADIQERLRQFTPLAGTSVRNPIDTNVIWAGRERAAELLVETIRCLIEAPNIDFVLFQAGLQWGPPRRGDSTSDRTTQMEDILNFAVEKCAGLGKPLIIQLRPAITPDAVEATLRFQRTCYESGIAVFPDMRRAAVAISKLLSWQKTHQEMVGGK